MKHLRAGAILIAASRLRGMEVNDLLPDPEGKGLPPSGISSNGNSICIRIRDKETARIWEVYFQMSLVFYFEHAPAIGVYVLIRKGQVIGAFGLQEHDGMLGLSQELVGQGNKDGASKDKSVVIDFLRGWLGFDVGRNHTRFRYPLPPG